MFKIGDTLGVIQGTTLVVPAGGSGVIILGMKGAARYDDVVRNTGDAAWTQGEKQYWDVSNKRFTKTAGSHALAGIARVATAASGCHRQPDHHDNRPDLNRGDLMARFIGNSNPVNLPAPSGGVTVRTLVRLGNLLVFAQSSAAEGETFVALREGVLGDIPAASPQVWDTVGKALYWDVSEGELTTTVTGNHFAGWVYREKLSAAALGDMILDYTHAT